MRKGHRGVLIAALSAAATIAASESLLRVFFPIENVMYNVDDRVGYRLAPGTRNLFENRPANGGGSVLVRVNRRGFRGPDFEAETDRTRVVVYGDSFVEAPFSPEKATYVSRLGGRLESALGRPVEAINAGVVGYGPDQVALRLESELPWLRPDLVVVVLYAGNDSTDLVRNKLFRLGPSGELLENRARRIPEDLRHRFRRNSWRHPRWWMTFRYGALATRFLKERLGLEKKRPSGFPASWIEECLDRANEGYERWIVKGDETVGQIPISAWAADVALAPDSPSALYSTRLLAGVLKRIHDTAAHARVPLLSVVVPSGLDITSDYPIRPDPRLHPGYAPRRLSEVTASAARAAGLPVLDLWEPFQRACPETLYRCEGDDHWNERGQDLAAERTVREIVERGILVRR